VKPFYFDLQIFILFLTRTLKENFKTLEAKYQETSQELDHVKSNSTPRWTFEEFHNVFILINLLNCNKKRPDWERCTMVVNEEKWQHLSNNKTSIQLLDTLLNEIQGKKHSSAASELNMGLVSILIFFSIYSQNIKLHLIKIKNIGY